MSLDDVPLLTTEIVIRSNPAAPSSLTAFGEGVKYKCRLCTNLRSGLHFTWESTFVNRQVLVREFSRAFAVDPVFSLESIAGQPAVNVWSTSEEELVLLNCSSMLSCGFSVLRVQIATNMHKLRDWERRAAFSACKLLCFRTPKRSTHSRPRAGATHLDGTCQMEKHQATPCILLVPPELLKFNRTWPSNVIHALPHLRKKKKGHNEASRGDDGAKPCGSGTRGPVERLQQSISASAGRCLERHGCNICMELHHIPLPRSTLHRTTNNSLQAVLRQTAASANVFSTLQHHTGKERGRVPSSRILHHTRQKRRQSEKSKKFLKV